MSRSPIVPDPYGDPPEHQGEAPLLFDPNAADPDAAPGSADAGTSSAEGRTLLIAGAAASGALIAIVGFLLLRPGGGETGEPPIPTGPVTTVETPAIVPFPDSVVSATVSGEQEIRFQVTNAGGDALEGADIAFQIVSGDGTLRAMEAVTDSFGVVSTTLETSERPGVTVVSARPASGPGRPGRVTVRTAAGLPSAIRISSGDRQSGAPGDLLPERVAVVVVDEVGNPVPNAEVRFRIDSGEGLTAPSLTRTDSTGSASALWRLGRMQGRQELTAMSSGVMPGVTFIATARETGLGEDDGERPPEATPVQVTEARYAVGGSQVCMIASGLVSCRGSNDRGQLAADGSGQFVSLTAGAAHVCGLDPAGRASCWGGNERGQLGDGSRTDRAEPSSVRTELRFSRLSAGAAHTCGLAGSGVPFCWGHNLNGQLGDGSRNDQTLPRTVGGGLQFRTIVSGWDHTCGLTSNGNAFCWGLNSQGQLGNGATLDQLVPTLVRGAVETLVAGSAHTCGVSEGAVLCWGANNFGQLGDGSGQSRLSPTVIEGLPGVPVQLAAGAVHTCALLQNGRAYCWGQNLQGQLGDGTTENRSRPVPVSGDLTFAEIHAGGAVTCGVTSSGAEYCWGLNQSGQLGDGTRVSRSVPTRVSG